MMGINTTHLYYFRIWWCYRAKFIRFFSLKRDSPENKKPRLSEVLSGFCGWSPQNTLCYVNEKKYTRSKTNAQFRHGFWRFWVWIAFQILSTKYCSYVQYLSILRVFAVSEGAAVLPAQRSPGWNGWCRQCLNPWSEHTVLRQSRCWQQAAERYASIVLLLTKRRRVWA